MSEEVIPWYGNNGSSSGPGVDAKKASGEMNGSEDSPRELAEYSPPVCAVICVYEGMDIACWAEERGLGRWEV